MKALVLLLVLVGPTAFGGELQIDDNGAVFCDGAQLQIDRQTEQYIALEYSLNKLTDSELCAMGEIVQDELNQ